MKIKELILLVLLVIPTTFSLFHPGFFGASDDMHVAWLQQMDQAIHQGQFPPRYVADLSYGFGYPLFNFIFPLPYYLGEVFHLLGLSYVYSIKAVFIFGLIGGAISMYILAKHLSSVWPGMAAAVLYTYTPYRSTDIYDRGALGESLAFIFLPLIIYLILRVAESNNNRKWVGFGALSVSGLILTHNIVSYMFMPFVFLFGVIILRKKIKELFMFFFFGMLGSVYFWLPALLDSSLMKYETVFNFYDHFPTLKQLLTPYWGYGASVPGNYDGISFYIGEVNLAVIIIVFCFSLFKFKKLSIKLKQIIGGAFILIAVSMVMMNFRSFWLWEHLPLIAYFQFPWRYLTMIVFASSLLVVAISKFRLSWLWSIAIICVSVGIYFSRFRPHDFLQRNDDYFINRYIPVPFPSNEYKTLAEEYLRLPKVAQIRPTQLYPRIYPDSPFIKEIILINSLDTKIVTESSDKSVFYYNKYFFPGWVATIDGKELNLSAGKLFGQIQFNVPEGKHEIYIRFKETPRNIVLDLLSLSTVLGCVYIGTKKTKDKIPLG